MSTLKFIFALLLAILPLKAGADVFLLMAEEDGCLWCEKWDEEIAHIYPKTTEGQTAPLVRYDMHDGTPTQFTLNSAPRFSPTFILINNGLEVGRIEGYPGEDFFWPLLLELFNRAEITLETTG